MVSLPYIKSAKRIVHRGSRFTTVVVESKGEASSISHHQQTQETSYWRQVVGSRHGIRWALSIFRAKINTKCGRHKRVRDSSSLVWEWDMCCWHVRRHQKRLPRDSDPNWRVSVPLLQPHVKQVFTGNSANAHRMPCRDPTTWRQYEVSCVCMWLDTLGALLSLFTTTVMNREPLQTSLFVVFMYGNETIPAHCFATNEHCFETSHNFSEPPREGNGDPPQSMDFP